MTETTATIGRLCDEVRSGWNAVKGDWKLWPETFKALQLSYYYSKFPPTDQAYCLAGLQTFYNAWRLTHGHHEISQQFLDEACAHEVSYHALRGRQFRRPCAALSTCWKAIVSERPERVLDRAARAKTRSAHLAKQAK